MQVLDKGYVQLVSVEGNEEYISRIAGISHDSAKGPSIEKLLDWGHFSPFEFASMTFKIKCPIFVARQLFRHRTGHYMEKSLRYCQAKQDAYIINDESKMKQLYIQAWEAYEEMIAKGYPKEQARAVLPVGIYTEYYFKMDMRNLISLLILRCAKDAQKETQQFAGAMLVIVGLYFPTIRKYIEEKC
jgi:thymidylate synthase (FAD)